MTQDQDRIQAALDMARDLLPDHLKKDPYWLSALLIFTGAPSLQNAIPRYFRFQEEHFAFNILRRDMLGYMSSGEEFLLVLAMHLFNDRNSLPPDGLSGMAILDPYHFELAMMAIRVRMR